MYTVKGCVYMKTIINSCSLSLIRVEQLVMFLKLNESKKKNCKYLNRTKKYIVKSN